MKSTFKIFLVSFVFVISNAQAQIITTISGTGSAGFSGDGGTATAAALNNPHGVASDTAGNIYIADISNQRIRKINSAGVITTIAGTGSAGYSGDGGPATAAQLHDPFSVLIDMAGNIYFCDAGNNRVRKISTTGIITTIAGTGTSGSAGDGGPATAAQLNTPQGLAMDSYGNLYIGANTAQRVRKISASGVISTFAGTGATGSGGDGGPATAATFSGPNFIHVDPANNVYITDNINNRIRKVSTSGIVTTFAGNGTASFAGDGGAASAASLNYPLGTTSDNLGNVYIADYLNNRIRKVSASGIITTIAGTGSAGFSGDGGNPISAQFNNPTDVCISGTSTFYVADYAGHRIRKMNFSGALSVVNNVAVSSPNILIYPVPATDNITITADNIAGDKVSIKCYSLSGALTLEKSETASNGSLSGTLAIESISPGIYYLVLQDASGICAIKTVIKN